ncbi:hypothetical protein Cfor_09701, partial [Coptotermes formosanus]
METDLNLTFLEDDALHDDSSGDIEQLAIVPNPSAVSQQCSATRIPLLDPTLLQTTRSDECSVTCGTGKQSRYSRCVDDGSRLELCMEAGGEHTETRACNREACTASTSTTSTTTEVAGSGNTSQALPDMFFPPIMNHTSMPPLAERKHSDQHKHRKFHHKNMVYKSVAANSRTRKPCFCQNGGMCHLKRRACHCPPGYFGRRCERVSCKPGCMNGGHCREPDQCVCPPHYTGPRCQTPVCQPPCLNGGVCLRPGVCSCPSGFLQPHCS